MKKIRADRIQPGSLGFTLVELIITMAIMGILSGVIIAGVGYANVGRTKKASNKLNDKLAYIQTETMTQKGSTNLYLYQTDGGVFTAIINSADGDFATRGELDSYLSSHSSLASKIGDSQVVVSATGGGGGSLDLSTKNNMLKIRYSKATGAFAYSNGGDASLTDFFDLIQLTGKETFQIKMIQNTGKHFISQG